MTNVEFVLSLDQRDEIMKAVKAIQRQVKEMVGKPIAVLVPPSRPGEEPLLLDELRERGRIDHYDTVRRGKDGRDVDVSVTISPIRDRHGEGAP